MNRFRIQDLGFRNRILILIMLTAYFFLLTTPTLAQQTEYTLLAPIPLGGAGSGDSTKANASTYIEGIFMLTIAVATGLAVLAIIFGGIKYMSTDAFAGKNEAKATIEHAIWGLLLAISAWLILNTINPKLIKFDLSLPVQSIPANTNIPVSGGGTPMTPAQIAESNSMREVLILNGILVQSGPCTMGQTTGCVNLNGLQQSVIDGLKGLHGNQFTPMITGGTEGGHSSHSAGNAVDISANGAITKKVVPPGETLTSCGVYTPATGGTFLWEPRGSTCGGSFPSSGDHWHVQF